MGLYYLLLEVQSGESCKNTDSGSYQGVTDDFEGKRAQAIFEGRRRDGRFSRWSNSFRKRPERGV